MVVESSECLAIKIRIYSLQMVTKARASHIASALSIADLVAVLYSGHLKVFPENPFEESRDRFILSKGHACVAIYAALALRGFFPTTKLETYGQDHSDLMNHISHKVPGVEFSTGSLGHGLPFGVGKAFSAKRNNSSWRVCVLLSDGEMDEGSNWEALMFAAHHRLDNLFCIIDYNKLQSLTTIEKTIGLEPLVDKLKSFGWEVQEIDGHNHSQIKSALDRIPKQSGKPTMIVAHTVKGKGVSFMENSVVWHYKSPDKNDLKLAISEVEANLA